MVGPILFLGIKCSFIGIICSGFTWSHVLNTVSAYFSCSGNCVFVGLVMATSALYACTKCNQRFPFEELSQGQQLCKVRPHMYTHFMFECALLVVDKGVYVRQARNAWNVTVWTAKPYIHYVAGKSLQICCLTWLDGQLVRVAVHFQSCIQLPHSKFTH